MTSRLLPVFALALCATSAHAAEYWVGGAQTCDFPTIQAAIAAAHETPDADTIRIADDQPYTNQTLLVDTSVHLIGGYLACGSLEREGYTSLSGTGMRAVIVVIADDHPGIDVHLDRLDIHNGGSSGDPQSWGGLSISGYARTYLSDSVIRLNQTTDVPVGAEARAGGGVTVRGPGAILTIERWVDIRENTGRDAGGILVDGGTLRIQPHGVTIKQNVVTGGGNGGGIAVVNGGVMSVETDPKGSGLPVTGVLVGHNTVEGDTGCGGGVYVGGANSSMLATNLLVLHNESRTGQGGGLCVEDRGYAQMGISLDGPFRHCLPEQECLSVSHNTSAVSGAAVYVDRGGIVRLNGVFVRGNRPHENGGDDKGNAFDVDGDTSQLRILNSVVADNACSQSNPACAVFRTRGGRVHVEHTTFARNGNEDGALIFGDARDGSGASLADIRLFSSLLADKRLLYTSTREVPPIPGATIEGNCVLKNRGRAEGNRGALTPITFLDADAGNYRLAPGNDAIDYCDGIAGSSQDPDLNRQPRGIDDPNAPDRYGLFDLGAYEFGNVPDRLFADGLEAGP
ncbi:hypothetical protein [Dokdonella sp.]|uniref:hypothetical protein n=1 Tax=Dokdonella sp. TaxID=2291710 RepID=UPI001B09F422|nr:hypothetical protein [Dokdonella sp.]MBO9663545.1 hypothetical protein [Dokdonella sp.]